LKKGGMGERYWLQVGGPKKKKLKKRGEEAWKTELKNSRGVYNKKNHNWDPKKPTEQGGEQRKKKGKNGKNNQRGNSRQPMGVEVKK